MRTSIKNILACFYILAFCLFNTASFAQSSSEVAGILPLGMTQFLDQNGKPLSSGKVYFKIPRTDTLKTTWQDAAETIPNANPVVLDAAGRAIIWGFGSYRQQVYDRNNNLIWDVVTASAGSGSGGGSTVGDSNIVGTILPWSGLVAPPNYVFAYGQELVRANYTLLLSTLTTSQAAFCTSGSPTLSGLSDTTQIPISAPVEASCLPTGTTVLSKTASSVTVSNNAIISTNLVATFFPWGNGNGSTTFNVPDYRGRVLAGRDNMGGTAASRLTSTYFANASAIGASGGTQSHTLLVAEMAPHTHISSTLTDPGHTHSIVQQATAGGGISPYSGSNPTTTSYNTGSSTTGITISANTGTSNSTTSTPFSIVQPTITLNYIIKVLPDTSASVATGVASLGGMTGVIACGTGIICNSNTITAIGTLPAGNSTQVQFNTSNLFDASANFTWSDPALTLGSTGGTTGQLKLAGATSGVLTQTVPAIAGTPVVTWGSSTGTPAVTASSPLAINTTTGNITCATCATTASGGSLSATAPVVLTGNVISLAAPYVSLTASNGGIVYSGSTNLAILAGTATARQMLQSGSSTTPAWSTTVWPATTGAGRILVSATANTITDTSTPTLGASGTLGSITMGNATSGLLTLQPVTGALGTVTVSVPAATDTLVNLASSQALTNKTYNGLTVTSSTGTLTIANSKTATVSNTLTFTGTDGSSVAFGTGGTVTYTVASGTAAMGTSAISSGACATVVTVAATGVATTDILTASFNGDPTGVVGYVPATSGMLTIIPYPTSNNVNFKVCNNTLSSITPGAITLNWAVRR